MTARFEWLPYYANPVLARQASEKLQKVHKCRATTGKRKRGGSDLD